ncbi:MAG: hypothetical protein PSX81_00470 [bacterium]|nr:hypothetical protein [bacterium]
MKIGIIESSVLYGHILSGHFMKWGLQKSMINEVKIAMNINQLMPLNCFDFSVIVIDVTLINSTIFRLISKIRISNPTLKVLLSGSEFCKLSFKDIQKAKVNGLLFRDISEIDFISTMNQVVSNNTHIDIDHFVKIINHEIIDKILISKSA